MDPILFFRLSFECSIAVDMIDSWKFTGRMNLAMKQLTTKFGKDLKVKIIPRGRFGLIEITKPLMTSIN